MIQIPLVAKVLLNIARGLSSKEHRDWVEAMVADIDHAAADGNAVRWSLGCALTACRLRIHNHKTKPSAVALVREDKIVQRHVCVREDHDVREEQSRQIFMANAVLAFGGVISLGLAIPLVASLAPAAGANEDDWSPLSDQQWRRLRALTDKPTKVSFSLRDADGYFPETNTTEFVWAIKVSPDKMAAERPELFAGANKVPYPIGNLGFSLFSPICPHLGGRYEWIDQSQKFICPVHGSTFTREGARVSGPAQRGLDPLPTRNLDGKAQITWIEYQGNTPAHIVLKIG